MNFFYTYRFQNLFAYSFVPVSRITTTLARKRPFHWISMKRRLVRAARENSKFQTDNVSLIVAVVTWLKYCRYGVKPYPINQSNNQSLYIRSVVIPEGTEHHLCLSKKAARYLAVLQSPVASERSLSAQM